MALPTSAYPWPTRSPPPWLPDRGVSHSAQAKNTTILVQQSVKSLVPGLSVAPYPWSDAVPDAVRRLVKPPPDLRKSSAASRRNGKPTSHRALGPTYGSISGREMDEQWEKHGRECMKMGEAWGSRSNLVRSNPILSAHCLQPICSIHP